MTEKRAVLSGRQSRAIIISVVIAIIGYLLFSLWGGWRDIMVALASIGIIGTLIVLLLSLVNYGLRFFRWQIYLKQLGYPIPLLASLRIYLSGFALTTTPGKAGEALRGILLKDHGVPLSISFAALISERLSDLIVIVIFTLLGLSEYPEAALLVYIGIIAILLLLVIISSQQILIRLYQFTSQRSGRIMSVLKLIIKMLQDARQCHQPHLFLITLFISLVAWGAEALGFYLILYWLGLEITLTFAIFIYALSMLAGALSFLPGGLGGAEIVMVSLLKIKGMPTPMAVAATVFVRLATLWFAVLIGLLSLMYHSLLKAPNHE